jgi:molybdopterin converting factor subunit 1
MSQVTIHVRLFAIFREMVGMDHIALELPAGSTVSDLIQELSQRWPNLRSILKRSAIAINQEYASAQRPLMPGDEVALIPPVSGG